MSYDVSLHMATGGGHTVEAWWGNCTSNCSSMWRLASPDTDGLAGLDGMLAAQVAPIVDRMIDTMRADPAPYRAKDPENGWGDYDSQLRWLTEIRDECAKHPLCVVSVHR